MTNSVSRVYELHVRLAKDSLQQLKLLQSSTKTIEKNLTGVANAAKGFAAAFGSFQFMQSVIQNTVEAEKAAAQLDATLKSTGRYTPELSQAMLDYSNALQKTTAFEDDAITGAQALLLTFTKVGGDIFPRATEAILDMATAMGTDLKSATLSVGKALNDPIKGMAALGRSGVQFTEIQKELVENMVATGDVVGAQTVILKELETQFGGSAEAAKETLGGALQSLQNTMGNLLEGEGGSTKNLIDGLNQLTAALEDPRTVAAMQTITTAILNLMTMVARALPELTGFTKWAAEELAAAFNGPAGDDIIRLEDHLTKLEEKAAALQERGIEIPEWLTNDLGKYGLMVEQYYQSLEKAATAPPLITPDVPPLIISTGKAVEYTTAELKKMAKAAEDLAESNKKLSAGEEYINDLRKEGAELTKQVRTDQEVFADSLERYVYLLDRGVISQETFNRAVWEAGEVYTKTGEEADKTDTILEALATRMDGYSSQMADTFIDFAMGADYAAASFSDMAASILGDIAKMITQMLVMKPLMDSLGGYFGFAGAAADGKVVDQGKFTPFAKGGVVTAPTLFPMANGTGLMGEAGPEAIMPLSRLPNGKLGVESGGGSSGVVVNVFNESSSEVTTEVNSGPDGEQIINIMVQKAVEKAIGSGRLDSTFQTTFGLQRRGY